MYKFIHLIIMVSLLVNIINIVDSMVIKKFKSHSTKHRSVKSEEHAKHLPRPPIYHRKLEQEFVDKFDEIFIIGDVHGCYDEMIEIINKIEASKSNASIKILKIFVGDLINKGPKNLEVIDYLMNHRDDCLSVRGNHEETSIKIKILDQESGGKLKKSMIKYKWAKNLTESQLNYLIELPYTISLNPSENETAIIVHAGLVAGLPLEKHDPYDLVHMRNYVFEDYYDGQGIKPVKSNNRGEPWCNHWPGPSKVYFGHNSKLGFQDCPYATGLDTGCVKGDHLTGIFIKGARKGTVIKVKSNQPSKTKHELSDETRSHDLVDSDSTTSHLKSTNSSTDSD